VTRLLVDTSVLIKWFQSEGEGYLREARALRAAHVAGEVEAHIIDLALYEVGNVLLRALRWSAADTAAQLDDLVAIVGPPLVVDALIFRSATYLAEQHGLSFYDASWAAAAQELRIPLVTADRRLIAASLAESPAEIANRLRLGM